MVTNRGRPAKPTALRALQGNPGHRRLNTEEPSAPAASTDAPDYLDELAAAFWDRYAPRLISLGLLTELDVPLFSEACQQESLYQRLLARISKAPFGKVAKEATRRANQAVVNRDRVLAQFGFSPSARAKIHASPKEEDPFEDFLRGKRA